MYVLFGYTEKRGGVQHRPLVDRAGRTISRYDKTRLRPDLRFAPEKTCLC
jgi:hypothetical protein